MAAELGGPLDAHAQAFLAGFDLLATEEIDETDAPGDDAEPPVGLDAMSAILADLIIVSEELEGPEAAYQTFAMATPPDHGGHRVMQGTTKRKEARRTGRRASREIS